MNNRIVEVRMLLVEVPGVTGNWAVSIRKQFAPENGGGEEIFTEAAGPNIHAAVDKAREMVTMSPARRTVES